MKLIGIIGKSGSGKTTVSRMLQKDESIAVIHVDDVKNARALKRIIPKNFVKNYTNNIGEQFIVPKNEKILDIVNALRKNKFLNKIYIFLIELLEKNSIKNNLERYKKEGKKCVIIERRKNRRFTNI